MNYVQLILQFVISGAVVVAATLISQHIDSKYSGLVVALPVVTILGFIFISINNPAEVTSRYLQYAIIYMIPSAVFAISLYVLHNKVGVVPNILLSLIPYAVVAWLISKYL